MMTELRLAELLCARLCHEISSPLGVILGALPLLAQGKADAPPRAAGEMAAHAARDATARLRLLRAAWSGEEMARDPAELMTLIKAGLSAPLRVGIVVDEGAIQPPLPPATGRLVINLALLAAQLRPRPAALTVTRQDTRLLASLSEGSWPPLPVAEAVDVLLREAARAEDPRGSQWPVTLLLAWRQGMAVLRDPASPGDLQIERAFPAPPKTGRPPLGWPERRRRR